MQSNTFHLGQVAGVVDGAVVTQLQQSKSFNFGWVVKFSHIQSFHTMTAAPMAICQTRTSGKKTSGWEQLLKDSSLSPWTSQYEKNEAAAAVMCSVQSSSEWLGWPAAQTSRSQLVGDSVLSYLLSRPPSFDRSPRSVRCFHCGRSPMAAPHGARGE